MENEKKENTLYYITELKCVYVSYKWKSKWEIIKLKVHVTK